MLRWRLLLGTLIIAGLVGLCWFDHLAPLPGAVLFPVAVAATVLATGEFVLLTAGVGVRPAAWCLHVANLAIVTAAWGPALWSRLAAGGAFVGSVVGAGEMAAAQKWVLVALAAGVSLAFVAEMTRYRGPGEVMSRLGAASLGMLYVGLLLSFVAQLRLAFGVGALASLVIVVKMGDTGAYAVGRLMGRHKMAPVLSPAKTVEGAVGGLVFACVGAWAAIQWLVPAMASSTAAPNPPAGPWWGWLCYGLAVGAAGMFGDLAESLLKRDAGRKDSSAWMPGFGGVLDILDSVLVGAPVAYVCWDLGLVGR